MRESLEVKMDWSPMQDLLDRLYVEGPPPVQYVERSREVVLAHYDSWEQFANTLAWESVVRECNAEIRRRMRDLVAGEGNPETHRAMLMLLQGLVALPQRVKATADNYTAGPDDAPGQIEVQ